MIETETMRKKKTKKKEKKKENPIRKKQNPKERQKEMNSLLYHPSMSTSLLIDFWHDLLLLFSKSYSSSVD